MGWRPQLNVICGRCGKPAPLVGHVCVSNSRRKQTLKPKLSFGKCPDCKKPYGPGGALTHDCAPRSDFKKRRGAFDREQAKRERDKKRAARPPHDYTECSDQECKRALCTAFKAGRALGDEEGFERGWQQGYARGLMQPKRESS